MLTTEKKAKAFQSRHKGQETKQPLLHPPYFFDDQRGHLASTKRRIEFSGHSCSSKGSTRECFLGTSESFLPYRCGKRKPGPKPKTTKEALKGRDEGGITAPLLWGRESGWCSKEIYCFCKARFKEGEEDGSCETQAAKVDQIPVSRKTRKAVS
ncbi:hypothetical protein HPP92_028061 [Vanilla planifolia]|uniref:Uncharacterized protein n=1 Tax=Vanilla planifolia TaxID=51239 RepID=A0A835U406_VANPL|nr:hypothetical protein HPP92_028061 [Vanilla planifolia]